MVLLLGAGGVTADVEAQAPSVATPLPCASPEHRQFDFWIGAWEVTDPTGKVVGNSRIESILGGCVLLEHWSGASGFAGKSLNLYNRDSGQWEQFWTDATGSRLHLAGAFAGGSMVMRGTQAKPHAGTGLTQHERITWTPAADGSVRQLWETSADDGATWSVTFDGRYRHPAPPPRPGSS